MKANFNFNLHSLNTNAEFSGLTVTFPSEVIIKEIPAKQIKASKVEVAQILDDSANKKVIAYTNNLGSIVLWQDAAYDAIGQWTDSDVQARIIELYS